MWAVGGGRWAVGGGRWAVGGSGGGRWAVGDECRQPGAGSGIRPAVYRPTRLRYTGRNHGHDAGARAAVQGQARQASAAEGPRPGLVRRQGDASPEGRRAEGARQGLHPGEPRPARGRAGAPVRERRLLRPDHPAGNGCCGEGRHDQACDVGPEPAGVPGIQLQEAVGRGTRPQLLVALLALPARTRTDRHLQPVLL